MIHCAGLLYSMHDGRNQYSDEDLKSIVTRMQAKVVSTAPALSLYQNNKQKCVISAANSSISSDDRFLFIVIGDLHNQQELALQFKQILGKHPVLSSAALILALYHHKGQSLFELLRGSLSIIIWDKKLQTLVLVRDHVGVMNLYWSEKVIASGERVILFSTSFKAIMHSGLVDRQLNRSAFHAFMRYAAIVPPATLIKHLSVVSQGSYVTFSNGKSLETRYWNLNNFVTNHDSIKPAKLAHKVHDAVHGALAAAQPRNGQLLTLLDGSVDSALLVALNATQSSSSMSTFSIDTQDESYRDQFAHNLSEKYGCTNEKISVDGRAFKNYLNRLAGSPELPGTDITVPFLLSTLGGGRGDHHDPMIILPKGIKELLRGRRYFKDISVLSEWTKHPVKSHFLPALSFGYENFAYLRPFAQSQQLDFIKHWPARKDQFYLQTRGLLGAEEYYQVMHRKLHTFDDITPALNQEVVDLFEQDSDFLNVYSKLEFEWNMMQSPLVYENNLQSSIRYPFLDPDLIKVMMQVPSSYKFSAHGAVLKPFIDEVGIAGLFDQYGLVESEPAGLPIGKWLIKFGTSELRQLAQAPWAKGEGMSQLILKLYRNPQQYQKVWTLLQFKQWMDYYHVEV